VVGKAKSTDGDISTSLGFSDFWLIKISNTGMLLWERSYGGSSSETPYVIKQTSDGGFVIAGETLSNDGDVSGNNGNNDCWVLKIDALGDVEWQNALGGLGIDFFNDIVQTTDGGYAAIGGTSSGDNGDVTGHHGGFDVWVVKLDQSGELLWQKTFGGSNSDWGRVITQTSDNGLLIGADTRSTDGDLSHHTGESIDWWILKLNPSGDMQWNKILGGGNRDVCRSLQQTTDGGFILAGQTYSNDGDVSGFHGLTDIWVVKLSPETTSSTLSPLAHNPLELYPNPTSQSITVQIPGDLGETRLSIRITDLLGREILQRACNSGESLDLAQLPNGMFLLSATSASGKVFFGKFRKQE
ncbi:MAG: T9SS type A sorting domain-containing protein, partial [Saprospiraceae bacterium]|nr:T9SS type A sorting domain-containing protein [Saprospiraceae bacterium]